MKTKFTISFESDAIAMAKQLAAEKNTSASDFLEQYIRRTYARSNSQTKGKGEAHFMAINAAAAKLATQRLNTKKSIKQLYEESIGAKYGVR